MNERGNALNLPKNSKLRTFPTSKKGFLCAYAKRKKKSFPRSLNFASKAFGERKRKILGKSPSEIISKGFLKARTANARFSL